MCVGCHDLRVWCSIEVSLGGNALVSYRVWWILINRSLSVRSPTRAHGKTSYLGRHRGCWAWDVNTYDRSHRFSLNCPLFPELTTVH